MRSSLFLLLISSTLFSCQNSSTKNNETGNDTSLFFKKTDNVLSRGNSEKPSAAISEIGRQVFISTCNTCHKDSAKSLAPAPGVLSNMTPRSILAALDNGKMRKQAEKLTEEQRKAVRA